MRPAVLAAALALLGSAPASAQVTINLRALDALPQRAPESTHQRSSPARHSQNRAPAKAPAEISQKKPEPQPPARLATQPASKSPQQQAAATPAGTTKPPAPASTSTPSVPASPPALPPPTEFAAKLPATPPPAAPTSAPASARPRSLAIQFAPGQTALTESETKSVAQLVQNVHPSPDTTFEVAAHAPEVNGDASSARRLSLARALAVRAALVSNGVPAANIYMRARGAPPPAEAAQADRTSITVSSASLGAVASSPAPEQASRQP